MGMLSDFLTLIKGTQTNIEGVFVGKNGKIDFANIDTSSLTDDNSHMPTSGAVKSAISNHIIAGTRLYLSVAPHTDIHAGGEITLEESADNYNFLMIQLYSGSITAANELRMQVLPRLMHASAWYPLVTPDGTYGAIKMKILDKKITIDSSTFTDALYLYLVTGFI